MAFAILPDISLDYKAGPRISPPLGSPSDDPTRTRAATSLISGSFQFVDSTFFSSSHQFLNDISSCTIDQPGGRVFLLRHSDPVVVVLDRSGRVLSQWTAAETKIKKGSSIKCRYFNDLMTVWVVDTDSSCIRPFKDNGDPLDPIGPHLSPGDETFGKITDVAWDSLNNFYVADGAIGGPHNRVVLLNSNGTYLKSWGTPAAELAADPLQLKAPISVTVDAMSRVWVVDSASQSANILVVSQAGNLLTSFAFSGYEIFDVEISNIRCAEKTAIAYVIGRKLYLETDVISNPESGMVFLLQVVMDSADPDLVGGFPPLTAYPIPATTFGRLAIAQIGSLDAALILAVQNNDQRRALQIAEQRPTLRQTTPLAPIWPPRFTAVLLLHPFEHDDPLVVAELHYDFDSGYMLFDLFTQEGLQLKAMYRYLDGITEVWIWIRGTWHGPFKTTAVIPEPYWIQAAGADFRGTLPLRNVEVNWWHQEFGKQHAANWHWFRTDNNHLFRTMNVDTSNPNKLPILGDFAFIYWPYFSPQVDIPPQVKEAIVAINGLGESKSNLSFDTSYIPQLLKDLTKGLKLDTSVIEENLNSASNLIPGFKFGDGGLPLPTWPEQFFMTCTMTPINRATPLSTEVTYDWPKQSQRTRMFGLDPSQQAMDCQLVNKEGQIFWRFENGDYQKIGSVPFGPPYPDWAKVGGGKIIATITDNPVLSPNTVTRIFNAPINPPLQFWIWYSDNDTPVVFMQTAPKYEQGTNLALADYKIAQTTPLIDPRTFDVPYKF